MARAAMIRPQLWIVLLRVVVGAWFLKAAWTKLGLALAAGVVPYPVASARFLALHPRRVAEFAAGNPLPWYREFLEAVVLPHAGVFATLQALGEVAVGLGLVLGVFTGLSALVGLVLSLNFALATQWMSFGQQGFHVLLVTAMMVLGGARAGRSLGVDAWLWVHAPRPLRHVLRWLG